MNDEEREKWEEQRIAAIVSRLKQKQEKHPAEFWEEMQGLVAMLVIDCADVGAVNWVENLYLADVLDKHLIRRLSGGKL